VLDPLPEDDGWTALFDVGLRSDEEGGVESVDDVPAMWGDTGNKLHCAEDCDEVSA
jgi:hypothetical protein